jgi:hypothetical protein
VVASGDSQNDTGKTSPEIIPKEIEETLAAIGRIL